jgi:hypothetical protein
VDAAHRFESCNGLRKHVARCHIGRGHLHGLVTLVAGIGGRQPIETSAKGDSVGKSSGLCECTLVREEGFHRTRHQGASARSCDIDQQLQKTRVSPATVDRRCGVASAAASEENNASGSHEGHSVTEVEGVGEPGAPDGEDPDAEFA